MFVLCMSVTQTQTFIFRVQSRQPIAGPCASAAKVAPKPETTLFARIIEETCPSALEEAELQAQRRKEDIEGVDESEDAARKSPSFALEERA